MTRAGLAIAATLLGAGCALPLDVATPLGPKNTCSTTSECGAGAVCVSETCVATEVDLVGLLIEVRPHGDAVFGATTSFLFDPAEADIPLLTKGNQPFMARMDPQLPRSVAIRDGRVRLHPDTALEQGCSIGMDRTIPASITFYRVTPFAGLVFEPIRANTNNDSLLNVDLVRGTYNVYIEPSEVDGCNGGKAFPPVFRSGLEITKDATTLLLDLPVAGTLTGVIKDADAAALAGWKLDLLEPTRGFPISSKGSELTPNATGGHAIKAQISWPEKDAPVLRLAPPAEMVQPTVYWKLSVVGCTTTNPCVEFSATDVFKAPVKVGGNVIGSDGFTRVRSSISIQSSELQGPNKENASYAIEHVETDDNGVFSLLLPPGKYDFRAFPVDNGLAITDTSFPSISPDATCFCGQSFLLSPKLTIARTVTTLRGSALTGATVTVEPAQVEARNYWASTHAFPQMTARPTTTTTIEDGSFTLLVDPAAADLVIQSAPGSGFPWLVRPRFDLTPSAPLQVTHPAMLSGRVRDPSGAPVPNADVKAWYPVRDPGRKGGLTDTVVKIATTSTDADGNYTLVLPSSI